jgi:hypothetical protein
MDLNQITGPELGKNVRSTPKHGKRAFAAQKTQGIHNPNKREQVENGETQGIEGIKSLQDNQNEQKGKKQEEPVPKHVTLFIHTLTFSA